MGWNREKSTRSPFGVFAPRLFSWVCLLVLTIMDRLESGTIIMWGQWRVERMRCNQNMPESSILLPCDLVDGRDRDQAMCSSGYHIFGMLNHALACVRLRVPSMSSLRHVKQLGRQLLRGNTRPGQRPSSLKKGGTKRKYCPVRASGEAYVWVCFCLIWYLCLLLARVFREIFVI